MDPTRVIPHTLRHTAITNLAATGADVRTIQEFSGHETIEMVLRYTHVHGAHIDQAVKAIGRAIPEPSSNETAGTATQELHKSQKQSA